MALMRAKNELTEGRRVILALHFKLMPFATRMSIYNSRAINQLKAVLA